MDTNKWKRIVFIYRKTDSKELLKNKCVWIGVMFPKLQWNKLEQDPLMSTTKQKETVIKIEWYLDSASGQDRAKGSRFTLLPETTEICRQIWQSKICEIDIEKPRVWFLRDRIQMRWAVKFLQLPPWGEFPYLEARIGIAEGTQWSSFIKEVEPEIWREQGDWSS